MLRNVLEDYLDGIREREFDLPLLRLLPLLGYYDVHFTHGPVEFGKDLIAKKREGNAEVQYVFQSKAGNITQGAWRNEVRGQVETALWSELSHPSFDRSLPRHVIVLTTGEFRHNAALEAQEFKDTIEGRHPTWSVTFWDKRDLIEFLLEHGLDAVYRASTAGAIEFDRFLILYARALRGQISVKELESHSRLWSGLDVDRDRRLLISAVEGEVLAQLCIRQGLDFEAAQFHLARLRLLCELAYEGEDGVLELWQRAVESLYTHCGTYVDRVREAWAPDRDLVRTWFDEIDITSYPVQCLRIMELASIAYFSTNSEDDRARHAEFIADFVRVEPGIAHPISDTFAVSLVLTTLVLVDRNLRDEAASLLERATVWLCDQYEKGHGLAGVEADEQAETNMLLGYPFEFIPTPRRHQSFLAAALIDLAAFLGDSNLYADIVNDLKACGITAEYWQPRDTLGACRYEGNDVLQYPSVEFRDALNRDGQDYAEHLAEESASFQFVELLGGVAAVTVTALLRDRYFPKLWPILAPNHIAISQ